MRVRVPPPVHSSYLTPLPQPHIDVAFLRLVKYLCYKKYSQMNNKYSNMIDYKYSFVHNITMHSKHRMHLLFNKMLDKEVARRYGAQPDCAVAECKNRGIQTDEEGCA